MISKNLKPDEIILKTVENNLVLSGERPRGPLYATYELLEKLGVRRWTARDTDIPHKDVIPLENWNIRYASPFMGRDRLGGVSGTYAAWMRVNGHYLNVPESHGGVIRLIGWCHTFDQMIPYDKYLKSHPEYFALVDGKRGGNIVPDDGKPQLCLSNPEVRKLLTQKTLERLRKAKNPKMISVSQNDCWGAMANNYCRCPICRALDEKEGSPSASLLSAVNEVADAVKKEFPDVKVETLAYQYTLKPPKTIKPRDNVIIRFCTRNIRMYPWDSEENAKCRNDFLAWTKITPQFYVWNYTTNFGNTLMPFPYLKNYGPDLRFMADHRVIAVLEQGYGKGLIGDLVPLQNYMACKLMWNPYQDQEAVIQEFLKGYYGAAAPELRKYIDAVWNVYHKNNIEKVAYSSGIIPLADYLKLKKYFDRAEAAVKDDPKRLLRVRTAAMVVNLPILHSKEADYQKADTPEGKALRSKIDLKKLVDVTRQTYQALNQKDRYREATQATIDRYIDSAECYVTGDWNIGKKIPAQFKNVPKNDLRIYGPKDFTIWFSKVTEENGMPVISMDPKRGWKVHFSFDPSRQLGDSDWLILAGLRTEAKGNPGGKVSLDVNSTHMPLKFIKMADIFGKDFQYVSLGVHKLNKKRGYIAFSPSGTPQKLQMQYLVLIRNGYNFGVETPDICKDMSKKDWLVIPAKDFKFWEKDIKLIEDQGKQVVADPSAKNSALQCNIPATPGKWRLLLTIRADGPANGNAAIVWTKQTGSKKPTLQEIGGAQYKHIEIGTVDLSKKSCKVTISRSYPATKLYVRNLIMIRQK